MKKYIRNRLLRLLLLLIGISLLSFLLVALTGTDSAEFIALRANMAAKPELLEQIRAEYGLDKPLPLRYFSWLGGIFQGNFGISVYTGNSVSQDLATYFPVTLQLVALSFFWIVVISAPLGLLCAARKNRVTDHIVRGVTVFGICLPPFWLGFLLLLAFAVKLPIFSVVPAAGIKGLSLPSIALAIPVICSTVRVFRASLLEELHCDYVSFALANGMTSGQILRRKVLRNTMPTLITLFCQYISYLIAGSAIVEKVFSLNGVGSYLMACVTAADSFAIAACMLIVAVIYLVAEFLGDMLNLVLCPWRMSHANAA
jgi:peptide/nickel transport system permease protein/nickel transport system permease protein